MTRRPGYTEGPVGRLMVGSAFPMLAGTLSISGYNIVDTYFVGQLGRIPLAAMGYTFPVVMFIGCIYHGLGGGATTPVAQYLGGDRRRDAARIVSSAVILVILAGILIGTLGLLSVDLLFPRLGATPQVMPDIRRYMLIWYLGSTVNALSMMGNHLLISGGTPRLAGMMMLVGMGLNALFDPVFISGWGIIPGMGVAGAAFATVVAQTIALALLFLILHFRLHLIAAPWRIPWVRLVAAWRVIARYGIPAMLGMVLNPIGMGVVTFAVSRTGGDLAVAATNAAGRLEGIAFIFPMSLGMTLLPMVAQNFGAKRFDRINECRRFAMRFAGIFLAAMSVVYFVFAREFAALFVKDSEVVAMMARYLRVIVWGFAAIEIHRYSTFFFTGTGHPLAAAVLNLTRVVAFMVPLALTAMAFHSLNGVFAARLVADLASGTIGCLLAARLTHRFVASPSSNGEEVHP